MKKIILLFSVSALIFTSCSSDDSGSNDQFVGNWRYYKAFEDDVEVALDECEDQTTLAISSNGTFVTTLYDNIGNGCEIDVTVSGTWENLGSGAYSTTSDGGTTVQQVEFSGNTMYFDDIDEGVTYRDVFIKE